MKIWLALSVLFGAGTAAADLPPWLYVAVTIAGAGGVGRWYLIRTEKRFREAEARAKDAAAEAAKQATKNASVERREMLDRMQKEIVNDVEVRLGRMRAALADAETERERFRTGLAERDGRISQLEKALADKERQIVILRHEVERLHDELLTTRAEAGLLERRSDTEDC